jgi:nitrous oxidase accessory protein
MRRFSFIIMFLSIGFCSARTLKVQSNGLNADQALHQANTGDTVIIKSGVYVGNILLDRRLVLIGETKPVIRGEGKGSVFTITADSCVLRGFIIEHSGDLLVDEDAGILIKSDGNLIEENELRDVLFGIYLFHSSGNTIRRNTIRGRGWLEVGERGSGIHIWNSRDNILVKNVISEARDGMYIQNAAGNRIEGNEIYNLRYGLHYMYSDSNSFTANRFHDNMAGAAMMYSRNLSFRRNAFVHNRGVSSFGILFQDCHNSVADSNLIADNGVGIFFEASGHNLFRLNTIAANDLALQMYTNSDENVFTRNAFVENINPLSLVGKRTSTRWSLDGVGNYWSQYDGYDFDGDGVGDVPLKIQNAFDYLEGNFPRLRLYLYSPAAQALEAAVRAFPLLEVSREFDEHPLMDRPGLAVQFQEISYGGLRSSAPFLLAAAGGVGVLFKLKRRQYQRKKFA